MPRIFGVKIGEENKNEIFDTVDDFLDNPLGNKRGNFVVTLNPEILLKAEKDGNYKEILNSANLKITDSFGVVLISKIKKLKIGERIAGVEIAEYILRKGIEKSLRIGIVMKRGGLSKKEDFEKFILKKGYPRELFEIVEIGDWKEWNVVKKVVLEKKINILLVGLGAPDQEKLVSKIFKDKKTEIKMGIGVGGTFDFWTGKKKRAPKFIQKIGMEWFWRLLVQPNRILRIWNATTVFLWHSLFERRN